ncbi:hypothetical protein [Pseudomonas syringae]|uniref:hypothetical protein n=1 Tax=Pseudomonas syringae TaxID=317 RepID=UPI00245C4F6F|nr:hypothetical protein [Pseudomonas syringae]MDH4602363.1 hypothetical protein [Pseudomonas syringae pv. papulans]
MKSFLKSAVLASVVAASALASGLSVAADQATSKDQGTSSTVVSGYVQQVSGGSERVNPTASYVSAHENDVRFNASVTDHNQNGQ